ncbi:MAG: hypothetical protein A2341_07355 [Deltaproteobacteria bacterium RIFOXYB12_FULL_58_9]|nr:MAG: hypothetical protein A2341_07355 [Deltaproteobacteria bacterium RIFOXYB12_FULL_58_9]
MRFVVLGLGVVAASVIFGCAVDLNIPNEAIITCASEDECPNGRTCNVASGRCVPEGRKDADAPLLAGVPTVNPPVLKKDAPCEIRFQVNEPLIAPPEVTLVNGPREIPVEFVSTDGAAEPTFVYSLVATGDEAQVDSPFHAVLIDKVGNTNRIDLGVSARFDFVDPDVQEGSVRLELVPGLDNPLDKPRHASFGTTIEVSFSTTEALTETAPTLNVIAGSQISFGLFDATDSRFVFFHTLCEEDSFSQGAQSVQIHLADDAGNAVDVPLDLVASSLPDGFWIDTVPPELPATNAPGQILYSRARWGLRETAGAPYFGVEGKAGAVERESTVIVYATSHAIATQELAREVARDDGSFGGAPGSTEAFPVTPVDLLQVYLVAVDAAGNSSDAKPGEAGIQASGVVEIAWTATMTGKRAGSYFANPHRFEWRPIFSESLSIETESFDASASMGIGAQDDETLTTQGAGHWLDVTPSADSRPEVGYPAMTYFASHAAMVAFGGADCLWCASGIDNKSCSVTWVRKQDHWSVVEPIDPQGDGNPGSRQRAAMAYHPATDRVVMFGGATQWPGGEALGDTWEWDGRSWAQKQAGAATGETPTARWGHSMALDERRNVILLFGGHSDDPGGQALGDIWEWNGDQWAQVCTTSPCADTVPSARCGQAMAFDPDLQGVVMFGGTTGSQETWTYDGEQWTLLCPSAACTRVPPGRADHSLTYDPNLGELLVFGGWPTDYSGPDTFPALDDMWRWAGSAWLLVTPADSGDGAPQARRGHAMAYDYARARTIMIGGNPQLSDFGCSSCCYLPSLKGTWEWDGVTWQEQAPLGHAPQEVSEAHLAFHEGLGAVVLLPIETGSLLSWFAWVDAAWRLQSTSVSQRTQTDMASDATRNRVVLFGGAHSAGDCNDTSGVCQDTWELDASTGWSERCEGGGDTCVQPPPTTAMALARDPVNDTVLLFGGTSSDNFMVENTSYAWDGGGWQEVCTATACMDSRPSPRMRHRMVTIPSGTDQGVLLFGGFSMFDSMGGTYLWNGQEWAPASNSAAPRARHETGLAYDASRGEVVLFGGENLIMFGGDCGDGPLCTDTWTWQHGSWRQPAIWDPEQDGNPPRRRNHGMAFDPSTERVLIYGGTGEDSVGLDDTWAWDAGAAASPGQLMEVNVEASGTDKSEQLVDLSVFWRASGTGYPGGIANRGVRLLVWDGKEWRTLKEVVASGLSDVTWTRSTDEPDTTGVLDRWLVGRQRSLTVAVVPTAANGQSPHYGEIATDYVEVTLTYRLPTQ